ncbi:N-acetyl-D-glucosamine kinase [compost metagenome]
MLGFTLGTGLGSAITRQGQVLDAALWCAPFRDGIAEDYFSTRWFLSRYEQLSGTAVAGVKVLADAASTDPHARQVFEEFGENFSHFLAPLLMVHEVDMVILGGNIARAYPSFSASLSEGLAQYGRRPRIQPSTLNEQAAIIGAAAHAANPHPLNSLNL